WGMEVTLVDGGATAFEAIEQAIAERRPYGLVLLDFHMPYMDGLEVARLIRQRWPDQDLTIVMLTSAVQPEIASQSGALGIAARLTKPFTQSELFDAIVGVVRMPAATAEPAPPEASSGNGSLRILLAEDNEINQKLAVRMLERHEHVVTVVSNGREAVEAYRNGTFDLVLMDVQMPEMNGFEATFEIRQIEHANGTRIPIVALTARAMEGDREECLAAGMDAYLSKPIQRAELEGLQASLFVKEDREIE
ncbi:MAG TPA: response regulator, partial [Rhodothermales bacterium]